MVVISPPSLLKVLTRGRGCIEGEANWVPITARCVIGRRVPLYPFSQRVSKVRGVKLRKLLISANGVLLSNDGGKVLVRFECLVVNAVITF